MSAINMTPEEFAQSIQPTLKTLVFDFLKDPSHHECVFHVGRGSILLIKSRYDDETDFIYLRQSFYSDESHECGKDAEYAGIYSHPLGQLADASYYLREISDAEYTANAVMKRFRDAASAKIIELVAGKPVPVETDIDPDDRSERERESFITYGADGEALSCFYRDCVPSFTPYIDTDKHQDTPFFVRLLNHFDDAVTAYAQQYVKDNARRINERLWEIGIVKERLQALTEKPGEHHLRKRIAQAIGDQKMVRIDIVRDGMELSCKIEASALKNPDSGDDYSTYRLDAPGCRAFEKAFGRSAHLYAHDINRITYGKTVLYQAE